MGLKRQTGGTLAGLIIGLALGLAIATAVAFYVNKAPVPFVDPPPRPSDRGVVDPDRAPDPNAGLLQGRNAPAGGPPQGVPGSPPLPESERALAALEDRPGAPAATSPAPVTPSAQVADGSSYLLQIGAFKRAEEAEALRARVALTGFEVSVVQADIDGATWHRVRLGPFARLDDLNRARARLAEAGIEGSVIRQAAAKPAGTP